MDWADYRVLCDRGDVLSRWFLEHSAELLAGAGRADLAALLRAISAHDDPLPRPADHRGGPEADFFEVRLALATVRDIAACVTTLAADPERRLANGRGLGGMAEAWEEFAAWLDGRHPRSPRRGLREEG